MHHHIRETTDRRSKVCIIIKGQSIVTDVMSGIFRFLHSFERHHLDKVLFFLLLDGSQQLIDGFRHFSLCSRSTDLVSETVNEPIQVLQFIRVWQVVNTIREHFRLLVLWYLAYKFGHSTVGQQHELFNQLIGFLRFLEIDTERFSLLVNFETDLHPIKVNGTMSHTVGTKNLCQLVELQDFFLIFTFTRFNHGLCFFVSKTTITLDDGLYNT